MSRRLPAPKEEDSRPVVYQEWPLFKWRLCSTCGCEFRREWGWEYQGYSHGPCLNTSFTKEYYLCGKCADSKGTAKHLARKSLE